MPAGIDSEAAARARAYARRMPERQCFSHATAAIIHGIPLPLALERDEILHVAVPAGSAPPASHAVRGHVLQPDRYGVVISSGLRLVDPATTWCQLGATLGVDDLVAAADYLMTGDGTFGKRGPLASIEGLRSSLRLHRGCRGAVRLREALGSARRGPLSRRETLLRLGVVRAGLPEPAPNHIVLDVRGRFVAMVDLAFLEYQVALEYQSDLHRTPATYRADVERLERLVDAGWLVVQITADGVSEGGHARRSAHALDRVRRRLQSRGWTG